MHAMFMIEKKVMSLSDKGYGRQRISAMLGIPQSRVYKIRKDHGYVGTPGLKKGVPLSKKAKDKIKETCEKNRTHGMSGSKLYRIYYGARQRCTNESAPYYKYYGGRGIKIHRSNFEEFLSDMYELYVEKCSEIGEDNISIERIDVDGDYKKENCTFIHKKKQGSNQRRHNSDFFKGRIVYAKEMGINHEDRNEYAKYWRKVKKHKLPQ